MPIVTKYRQGVPNWIDVSVTDIPTAVAFYEQLFGWEGLDMGEEAGHYHLFRKDGRDVAGLGPTQGPPISAWMTYLAVDDLDAVVAKVPDAGGTVLAPRIDVFTNGSMAVAADPSGAVVSFWQAADHIGCSLVNEANTLVWNELTTRDPDRATAFYSAVVGTEFAPMDEGDPAGYRLMRVGERVVAGVQPMVGDQWGDLPSHWMVYFVVDDPDATAARAVELGGSIVMPTTDIQMGRFSVIADPCGAPFTVMSFNDPVDDIPDGVA
jgi:hypothetical protein